ncbi:MAG: hypothetical protein ACHQNA_00085 [Acidimicrobiales bacterium]
MAVWMLSGFVAGILCAVCMARVVDDLRARRRHRVDLAGRLFPSSTGVVPHIGSRECRGVVDDEPPVMAERCPWGALGRDYPFMLN